MYSDRVTYILHTIKLNWFLLSVEVLEFTFYQMLIDSRLQNSKILIEQITSTLKNHL